MPEVFESIGIPTATIDVPTQHTSDELESARTEADQLHPMLQLDLHDGRRTRQDFSGAWLRHLQ